MKTSVLMMATASTFVVHGSGCPLGFTVPGTRVVPGKGVVTGTMGGRVGGGLGLGG